MMMVKDTYPRYFVYEERPVVFIETPGGGLSCVALNPQVGDFQREMYYIAEIDFNHGADYDEVSYDDFVPAVEVYRARNGLGEGTVKALYETMHGLEETARAQGRRQLSPEEQALVRALSKRTHPLFEGYLRERGLTGTPQPTRTPLRMARLFDSVDAAGRPVVQRPPVPDEEREGLLRYLAGAPIVLAARGFDTDVLDPAGRAEVPMTFHTDGTWIWPGAVAYYLREHGVAPEPDLVGWARGNGFEIPEVDEETRAEAVRTINEPASG
ncbi:hypothetical protein [Actinomadura rubrisoli]|uniref:Uncharacterized protein n=1 Tax=Actinomadura rubrisoli TaxID=2530368 RepID=A0A4R5A4Q8_9ACTN|nr:hypothetical protein [Actinomadura rubrisoli]TDD64482.1 hypothetical protein E1298_42335 [Actinomadura rubrisoli]